MMIKREVYEVAPNISKKIDNFQGQQLKAFQRICNEINDFFFRKPHLTSLFCFSVSFYQPLRSAVEHNPLDDDNDDVVFETYSQTATKKKKFLKLVNPKRLRKSKQINLAAYVIPLHPSSKPQSYRSGSPYQELVDVQAFEQIQLQKQQVQPLDLPQQSQLKLARNSGPKVVCHITNWSYYRKGEGKFVPENLDTNLCTHIIYNYASLAPNELELVEFDPWGDIENQLYSRTVNLDKDVPVLLGLGGWTDSSGNKYSQLVSSPAKRKNFISRAANFLRQYGFAGLHVDWNYPVCWQSDCRAGPATDKDDFTDFIRVRNLLASRNFKKIIQIYYRKFALLLTCTTSL
jgi:chitinase